MSASSSGSAWLPLLAAVTCATAPAQGPRLHAAIAASEHRGAAPALAWLCEDYLPTLSTWPDGLDPHGTLSLTLSADGITIGPTEVDVPEGAVAIGTASFSEQHGGPSLMWRCERNGQEHWTIQPGFDLPRSWHRLLVAIEADVLDMPRSLAVPVLAGHLSGSMLEGDPRATLLRICPAMCGDVTWMTWQDGDSLRVSGQSAGGLMLPLALLMMAVADGDAEPSALQLRAFARLRERWPAEHADAQLVVIGACRCEADARRVTDLRALAAQLGLADCVQILPDVSYAERLGWLRRAAVGLHTMWMEHFGIGVVELMASGVVPVAHASGGPLADIVLPVDGMPSGRLACSADEYAEAMHELLQLARQPGREAFADLQSAARRASARFSDESFERAFVAALNPLLGLTVALPTGR